MIRKKKIVFFFFFQSNKFPCFLLFPVLTFVQNSSAFTRCWNVKLCSEGTYTLPLLSMSHPGGSCALKLLELSTLDLRILNMWPFTKFSQQSWFLYLECSILRHYMSTLTIFNFIQTCYNKRYTSQTEMSKILMLSDLWLQGHKILILSCFLYNRIHLYWSNWKALEDWFWFNFKSFE